MLSDPLFRHLRPEPSIFGNQSRGAVTGRAHGNLLSSDHFQISNGSANTWLLIIICIILPSWQTVSHFAVLYPIQSHCCMPCTYLQGILIRSCKGRFPFTESALLFILQSQKQFGQVFRILHLVPSILHAIVKGFVNGIVFVRADFQSRREMPLELHRPPILRTHASIHYRCI